jgi:lysophospholipase L1-like esterase
LETKGERFEFQSIYGGHNTTREPIGLAPVKNSQWGIKLTVDDSLVFDVIETIDSSGFRFTPQHSTNTESPVVFFGCSFTYGHGLIDDETLPAFLQASNPEQWHAINMGYNGYGVHQTLAMLETQMVKELLKGQSPKAAFFTAITDHVFRGVGRISNNIGPQYKLDANAGVTLREPGPLDGRINEHRVKWLLSKSSLLRRILLSNTSSTVEEIDLYIAMVKKASTLFTDRYSAPFYCLLWNEPTSEPGLYEELLHRLNEKEIPVIEVSDILPGYQENPWKYLLYKDGHPNALANQLIAEHLNKLLVQ